MFRQKTKAKSMYDGDQHYGYTAFQYIHQNPFIARLVTKIENWKYSSFADFAGLRKGTLCDQELASELIGFDKSNFLKESYQAIDEELIKKIFM